jgi:DNA-binding GntR family transcriptional regulator
VTRTVDDPRIYRQIINDLRSRMDLMTLQPGAAMSITYLSQEWETSRPTVSKALQHLEHEGRLRRYPGLGYYVRPRSQWQPAAG